MKRILLIAIAIAVAGGLIFAYLQMSKERAQEAEREKPVAAESKVSRNTNGETVITIDAETQKRLALKIEGLTAGRLPPEIKGYGRVLDPTSLSSLAADLMAARATADASQKEWDRLKVLSVRQNASERALQAAEATAQRDNAQADSSRQHLLAAWGKAIADRPDLREFVQSLSTGDRALVRIDLLAGDSLKTKPESARLFLLSDEINPVEAEFVSSMPSVDAQTQGQGFLFLVNSNRLRFAPGAAVLGYLKLAGAAQSGVLIPRNAVIRFNGKPWVYLQTGEEAFVRREISEEHPFADGWFMKEEFKPSDHVIVIGAQMLLSEEQKYQIQMGD
jgi:multidrug efflux system membrane fusion protein